jgi:uncharacterized membrane protein YkvI
MRRATSSRVWEEPGVSERRPSWFQRFLLPGFAFKAVVIGGGYATGRELAEFFLPSGPVGGLMGILLTMAVWSLVCAITFVFAHATCSFDYRTFFHNLLGPFWFLFEATYILFIVLILAVFGAAAGAIAETAFDLPKVAGTVGLMAAVIAVTTFGNEGTERLFKYASVFLYAVYAIFFALALTSFGDRIFEKFSTPAPSEGWALGGLTYAGYNVVAAVVILPVVRHITSARDAVAAGALSGVLGMAPALLFFCCMVAYYPEIGAAELPSDVLLGHIGSPIFHLAFQAMILVALLETSAGVVNAINERAAQAYRTARNREFGAGPRLAVAAALIGFSVFLADRFGFVALIANGYRAFGWIILAVYVLPLLTIGLWRLVWRFAIADQLGSSADRQLRNISRT